MSVLFISTLEELKYVHVIAGISLSIALKSVVAKKKMVMI